MSVLRRPEVALFVLALSVYGYFYQAGGWNQNSRFDLTRAVVEHGTSSIDRYHRNTGDKARRGRHYYCDKAPGASWLGVPAYAVAWAVAGSDRPGESFLAASAHVTTVFAVGVPSALALVLLYQLLALMGVGLAVRIGGTLAYGFGTLALPYSTMLYGHQLMAALLSMATCLLIRERHGAPLPWWGLGAVGVCLGLSVVVEYPAALAVAPLCMYAVWVVRPWRRLAPIAVGGAVAAVALAVYHWSVFGGPLTLPYEFSTQTHRHQGVFMGLGAPDGGALVDILFTSYRGLFYSAPWLLLALAGAVVMVRRRQWRVEAIGCAAIVVLFVWLNASLVDWQGGWAIGARYLIGAIPFLVILACGLALDVAGADTGTARRRQRVAWIVGGVLAGYSVFMMAAATAVKPEVPTHIRRPFQQFVFPALWAGKVAINDQSIDSATPERGAKHAWNVGEQLGLTGLGSLAPLGLVAGAAGAWLVVAARRRERAPKRGRGRGRGPTRPGPG